MRHRLSGAGYLGNYHLIPIQGPCHRTAVAVRTQTLNFRNWKRYVAGLSVDDLEDEVKADKFLVERILQVYLGEAQHALGCLRKVGDEQGEIGGRHEEIRRGMRDVLVRRWGQIRGMVEEAREMMSGGKEGKSLDRTE